METYELVKMDLSRAKKYLQYAKEQCPVDTISNNIQTAIGSIEKAQALLGEVHNLRVKDC